MISDGSFSPLKILKALMAWDLVDRPVRPSECKIVFVGIFRMNA